MERHLNFPLTEFLKDQEVRCLLLIDQAFESNLTWLRHQLRLGGYPCPSVPKVFQGSDNEPVNVDDITLSQLFMRSQISSPGSKNDDFHMDKEKELSISKTTLYARLLSLRSDERFEREEKYLEHNNKEENMDHEQSWNSEELESIRSSNAEDNVGERMINFPQDEFLEERDAFESSLIPIMPPSWIRKSVLMLFLKEQAKLKSSTEAIFGVTNNSVDITGLLISLETNH